jgi:hypothetical protein
MVRIAFTANLLNGCRGEGTDYRETEIGECEIRSKDAMAD